MAQKKKQKMVKKKDKTKKEKETKKEAEAEPNDTTQETFGSWGSMGPVLWHSRVFEYRILKPMDRATMAASPTNSIVTIKSPGAQHSKA